MARPTINITIRTDGAAFDDVPETEIGRILRQLAEDIEKPGGVLDDGYYHPLTLHDVNGNATGTLDIAEDDE